MLQQIIILIVETQRSQRKKIDKYTWYMKWVAICSDWINLTLMKIQLLK